MQYDARLYQSELRSMAWLITNFIAAFLLPPFFFLLLAIAGLLFWKKRKRLSLGLLISATALLWIFSTPYVAQALFQYLEQQQRPVNTRAEPADAIVVLGGGTYFNAPEYGGDTVSEASLQRLRYAAKLFHETGRPILVTGGKPLGNALSEAAQMKSVLEQEFKIPVQWTEDNSDNTFENARYSYTILHSLGIKRIYLVTHAWHMPRAVLAFKAAGFEVVAAPTVFTTRFATNILSFIPSAHALSASSVFIHEEIGLLWYRLKSLI